MAIDLINSEKSTFFRFLFLYLGSSLILLLVSIFFYYENEKNLYIDLIKSNMQNTISKASNEIIISHMMGNRFDKEKYLNSKEYKISFYDKNKNLIFGNVDEKIDFSSKFISSDDSLILIDNSTVGHLGIEYIVLKDSNLKGKIKELQILIVSIFVMLYMIISIIGFYLAKLFLKPIKDEREKLNNFIKDTTHELNTPISAILMSTESEILTQKQIERIRLSAKRVSEIYKDLTFVFLENKELKKDLKNLDLKEIIKEQIDTFEPLYKKKKIEVKLSMEKTIYNINTDDFIRLFNNIFSNAIKYNKMAGKIEVVLKNRILTIKDSGIGINKDKLNDIYKRYYRATSINGGFGLGLNIVNIICRTYNIKIEVVSEENLGTTFILKF